MDNPAEKPTSWSLQTTYKLIFLSVAIIVLVVFATLFIITNINSKITEMDVVYNKIIYSSDSFMLTDPALDRTYTGIVDLSKFTEETLNKTINYSSKRYGVKVSLEQLNNPLYYPTKERYEFIESMSGFRGAGSADKYSHQTPVLTYSKTPQGIYKENNMLNITVLRLRS